MRTGATILVFLGLLAGIVSLAVLSQPRARLDTVNERRVRQDSSPDDLVPASLAALVRVNLTPEPLASIRLAIDGPFEVRDFLRGATLAECSRLRETTVALADSGWRIGPDEYRADAIEIVPRRPPAVWVGDHQYRGRVRLYRQPGQKLIAVNVVPLEEYVASVVNGEMPQAFPDEARKAQAVVARTYALYRMREARGHPHYDVFAGARSQAYPGFQYRTPNGRRLAGENADSRRIARETAGMVCTFRGDLFCTYYTAVCGGRTVGGREKFSDAAACLQSVPCRWCAAAERYRWTARLSREKLIRRLRGVVSPSVPLSAARVSIRPAAGERPGRYPRFVVTDGRARGELRSDQLRRALGRASLPSPLFSVRDAGGAFVFTGRGHGHGVGLCQWGARGQAAAGRSFRQILQSYYPGCRIRRLSFASRNVRANEALRR